MSLMNKSKPNRKPPQGAERSHLDTRIVLRERDKALAAYIKEQAHINRREPNAQIILMLAFAAERMSAIDQEGAQS